MSALPLSEIISLDPGSNTSEPDWLNARRRLAFERLSVTGLPAEGSENWRYSSLRSLLRKNLNTQSDVVLESEQLLSLTGLEHGSCRMVFVNGLYQAHLSLVPDGMKITNLASELENSEIDVLMGDLPDAADAGFSYLNTAKFQDGLLIQLEKNTVCEQPIYLIQLSSGDVLSNTRHLIQLAEGAGLTLIEHVIELSGETGGGLLNSQFHVVLADNARLDWTRSQTLGGKSTLVDRVDCRLSAGSHLHCTHLDLGGLWVRHDFNVELQGQNGFIEVDGVVLVRGRQHTDFHTRIDHQVENCTSRENFKCIADGRSRGVYNGKILVQVGADGTDSAQKSANLLLSEHAEIDTKPDLEILADDVIASHGATVGQLDEDALFYMRTRGIDEELGRKLLMRAFCQEVIDLIAVEPARNALSSKLDHAFAGMELAG